MRAGPGGGVGLSAPWPSPPFLTNLAGPGFLKVQRKTAHLFNHTGYPVPGLERREAPGHSWPFLLQLGNWSHVWGLGVLENYVFRPLSIETELSSEPDQVGFQFGHPRAV